MAKSDPIKWLLMCATLQGQVTSYKLQVASYKLQVTSYKLQVTSYRLQGQVV